MNSQHLQWLVNVCESLSWWSTCTVSKNPPETNRNSKHKWWTFAIRDSWCSWCNFKKSDPNIPISFQGPRARPQLQPHGSANGWWVVPFPGTLKTWRKKWSFCHNFGPLALLSIGWFLWFALDRDSRYLIFQKSIVARQQPPGSIGSNESLPHPSTTLWPTNEDQKYLAYKWYWYTQDAFPVANGKFLLPCFFTKW